MEAKTWINENKTELRKNLTLTIAYLVSDSLLHLQSQYTDHILDTPLVIVNV